MMGAAAAAAAGVPAQALAIQCARAEHAILCANHTRLLGRHKDLCDEQCSEHIGQWWCWYRWCSWCLWSQRWPQRRRG